MKRTSVITTDPYLYWLRSLFLSAERLSVYTWMDVIDFFSHLQLFTFSTTAYWVEKTPDLPCDLLKIEINFRSSRKWIQLRCFQLDSFYTTNQKTKIDFFTVFFFFYVLKKEWQRKKRNSSITWKTAGTSSYFKVIAFFPNLNWKDHNAFHKGQVVVYAAAVGSVGSRKIVPFSAVHLSIPSARNGASWHL